MDEKLQIAIQAVKTGGKLLRDNRHTPLEKKMKSHNDFATQLDIECEDVIKKILLEHFPDIPIVAEESGLTKQKGTNKKSSSFWYVDPLDGTKAFFNGNIAFTTISISLASSKGAKIAVIYNPFTDTLYTASTSSPAQINGHDIIQSNSELPLKDSKIILDFSSRLPDKLQQSLLLLELEKKFNRIFRYEGSVAQHLCLIGSGVHDGGLFWNMRRKGNYYDIGAALFFCEKAGLTVTNFNGKKITPRSKYFSEILVAPKQAHKEMLQLITELKEQLN